MKTKLVFAYNADSGLFNTLTDIAHKLLSPATYACNLCAITHGHLGMREQWKTYLQELDAECEFLHRDELTSKYEMPSVELPAVYCNQNGQLSLCVSADAINQCKDMDCLQALISENCL